VDQLKASGAAEVLVGDMLSQERMNQVYKGVRAVYHIPPNISPEEFHIGQIAINAAQSAGVEHFVYHSVLHPQIQSMPHHWEKMRVEAELFKSGLPFTVLQPAVYMQNILAYWEDILGNGIYRVPYSADTRLSFVDLVDVAQAAGKVLTESGHEGAVYELCGPDNLSVIEIAQTISRCLNRKVEVGQISVEEWELQARDSGLGDYQVNALIEMFRYYERFGFTGNANVLEYLLERPANSFLNFIKRTAEDRS
jgi:uncharacterized protein YbjT (DUF2867 family)